MTGLPILKINERSNVEQLNLRDTKIGNKNLETWFISKNKYGKFEEFPFW